MSDDLIAIVDAYRSRSEARPDLLERLERTRALPPEQRGRARRSLDAELEAFDAMDRAAVAGVAAASTSDRTSMLAVLARLSAHPLDDSPHLGDEPLDRFVEALLGTEGRYDGGASPGEEMIHYDPSPASASLVLARRGWFDEGETFIDLGSGTGRVVTLGMLLGRGRVVGVEIDEALVEVHRASARRLSLVPDVRVGDARTAELEDGSRFFFFAPFLGSVLEVVLERLRAIARTRTIHVGSWGPSTAAIARADFLIADREASFGPFDLATFRAGPERNHL